MGVQINQVFLGAKLRVKPAGEVGPDLDQYAGLVGEVENYGLNEGRWVEMKFDPPPQGMPELAFVFVSELECVEVETESIPLEHRFVQGGVDWAKGKDFTGVSLYDADKLLLRRKVKLLGGDTSFPDSPLYQQEGEVIEVMRSLTATKSGVVETVILGVDMGRYGVIRFARDQFEVLP